MRIFFAGDIVGLTGRRALEVVLPGIKGAYSPDVIIANGENSAHGMGISGKIVKSLETLGIDCITLGNHTFSNREFYSHIGEFPSVVRPANMTPAWPGNDWCIIEACGMKLGVINLLGQVESGVLSDNPFFCADRLIEELKSAGCDAIFMDFHAEATSEKCAMGYYCDGRVSVVVGTHTHVQTADEKILPGGTGYITDAGMCGAETSVLGMDVNCSLSRLAYKKPAKYEPAGGPGIVCGIIADIDEAGKCTKIQRICEYE